MEEIKIRPDKISVGANIKQIRQANHVKAYDLIRELQLQGFNINKQRYYKLEHDLANVYASELVAIAKYLHVEISEFFKEEV